jgi:hypothetical protein
MLRAETPISHPILLSVSLGNSYTGSARPRPFHRDRHSPGFGFSDGGDRRGTRLIGVDSFFRRSKPYRARASSPFDVVFPDRRAIFSNLFSSSIPTSPKPLTWIPSISRVMPAAQRH